MFGSFQIAGSIPYSDRLLSVIGPEVPIKLPSALAEQVTSKAEFLREPPNRSSQ